eukprot:2238939-Rhodomonas_salina.1
MPETRENQVEGRAAARGAGPGSRARAAEGGSRGRRREGQRDLRRRRTGPGQPEGHWHWQLQ